VHPAQEDMPDISARGDVEELYDHYSYLPEIRETIENWETHLAYILTAQTSESTRAA
jgi:hypothetical protein